MPVVCNPDSLNAMLLNCQPVMGGIKTMYFFRKEWIDNVVKKGGSGADKEALLDLFKKETITPGTYFVPVKREFKEDTAFGTSVLDPANNTYTQTIGCFYPEISAAINAAIIELGGANSRIVVLAEHRVKNLETGFTNENKWFLYGLDNGLKLATHEQNTGVARTDPYGNNYTLVGQELEPSIEVLLTKGTNAVVTASQSTTVLTVAAVTSGSLVVGDVISGTGITAGTRIVSLGTGAGGVGTYNVSTSATAASTTVTVTPFTAIPPTDAGTYEFYKDWIARLENSSTF